MRFFAIAADVFMGLILGLFLNAALTGTWPALRRPVVTAAVIVLAILVVLFRRPSGSLARRSERH